MDEEKMDLYLKKRFKSIYITGVLVLALIILSMLLFFSNAIKSDEKYFVGEWREEQDKEYYEDTLIFTSNRVTGSDFSSSHGWSVDEDKKELRLDGMGNTNWDEPWAYSFSDDKNVLRFETSYYRGCTFVRQTPNTVFRNVVISYIIIVLFSIGSIIGIIKISSYSMKIKLMESIKDIKQSKIGNDLDNEDEERLCPKCDRPMNYINKKEDWYCEVCLEYLEVLEDNNNESSIKKNQDGFIHKEDSNPLKTLN